MRTIFVALAALMFMCIGAPAFAQLSSADEKYAAQIRVTISEKVLEIKEANENFVVACKDLPYPAKGGCETYYRVIVARRTAEMAELELQIAALPLNSDERIKIHTEVIPATIYNARKDDTNRISGIAKQMFPPPKKSASK